MNNMVELELHKLENVSGGWRFPPPPPPSPALRAKLLAWQWAQWLRQFR